MQKIKLAIVGSREFSDYKLLEKSTDSYLEEIRTLFSKGSDPGKDEGEGELEIIIVSGGARGADSLAEKYAKNKKYQTEIYPVTPQQWKDLGKIAGILRNTEIVNASDYMIAFPSKTSKGTLDSIKKMKIKNGNVKIIKYDQDV